MAHLAFLSPPFRGHIDPMLALADEMKSRGHGVTFLGMPDVAGLLAGRDVGFEAIGRRSHPPGTLSRVTRRMAAINGPFGLGAILRDMRDATAMVVDDAPRACRELGIDAVIGDQTEAGAGLVARHLGLPFASIANALPLNRDPVLPPPFTGWRYDPSPRGRKRNAGGYRVSDWLMRSHHRQIAAVARRWQLGALRTIEDCASPTLQLSQMVQRLDFPREQAPRSLHYVGPFRSRVGSAIGSGTFARTDRPLVFASLGSLQGGRADLFRTIAAAAASLDTELVIAHGGKLGLSDVVRLPGNPRVFDFVPQREILPGASLAIVNGGLNTVLDAFAAGVPAIIVPIAFEQAAIAERVVHAGAGLRISRRFLTDAKLRRAMRTVLDDPSFTRAACRLRDDIARAPGVPGAADLIEDMLRSAPVRGHAA